MTDENIMKTNLTRRSVLIGGAQLLAATAILPRFANAAEELNILVWCDHADTKLIGPFEASHGVGKCEDLRRHRYRALGS